MDTVVNALPVTRTSQPDYLAALNAQQRAAVEYGISPEPHARPTPPGALLVIAGAGSGKTNTLAYRVAHAVRNGADPFRLLLLTFSRRSAVAMERRAGRILNTILGNSADQAPTSLPWAGTFHSVGARLLREYAERVGLNESFTIQDRGDSEDLMALARHELALENTARRFPTKATCLAIYSRAINSKTALFDVLKSTFPWCIEWEPELKKLFAAYTLEKQRQNVLDYDDLLLYWAHMVADPDLAQEIGSRFDHILVDEYQDTNLLQSSILMGMKPTGQGVTVVGDDAQSIYAFRAATVRNILDFPAQFPEPAHVVTLERNYRSTRPILDASNAVIGLATERFTKNLWTERTSSTKPALITVRDEADQARCVAARILENREAGMTLKSQAVLFRASSHSAPLELELARRNIPFVKFGGLKFLEAGHIKDVLALLRWAENPRGRIAGFRALQLLPGIGPATATRLLDAMEVEPEPEAAIRAFRPPLAAAENWETFRTVYLRLKHASATWPADMALAADWFEPHLDRLYEDAHARKGDLAQLKSIAGTFPSRARFLTELTLDPPSVTSDNAGVPHKDEDYLILSTIHSAKGQEWKTVHVLNVVDGCIPADLGTGSNEELEEERRLFYVAMTRAKDELHLMVPQRFYVHQQSANGDRHVYALRSRFIPSEILSNFEERIWPVAASPSAGAVMTASHIKVDLVAKMKALWH
ncbi:MAG: ATP-dependent helicase [Burkholderiales bacterium]|nr:ATP-dependent helicase [Burkholderiales bacterium]